jgi:hypothetical protein
MLALRLQVPAIVAKLPTRNVVEHEIRRFGIKVGLMQGDDVGMGTYLAQHVDLSLSGDGIGAGHHNGKSDLPASFRIPRQICLFTRALSDQMIDTVAASEERARGSASSTVRRL